MCQSYKTFLEIMYSLFCQLDHFVKEISFLKWPGSKERVSKFTLTFLYSIIIERIFL